MLIARGADVNAKEPSQNQTALMWAAAEHHPDVVKLLIEQGADLQARTKNGFTALHFAAREGDIESARLLLAAGIDINIRSQPATGEPGPSKGETRYGGGGGRVGGPSYEATVSAGSTPLLVATVRAQVPLALFLARAGGRSECRRRRLYATALGGRHLGKRRGQSCLRIHRCDERDSRAAGETAARRRHSSRAARTRMLPMTQRPPGFAGGYDRCRSARRPFSLASAAADIEMMRLLLRAGADPKRWPQRATSTAIMAATGVNRVQGESAVTEAQALEVVKLLLELGVDAGGGLHDRRKCAVRCGVSRLEHAGSAAGRTWRRCERGQQSGTTPWLAASGHGDRLAACCSTPKRRRCWSSWARIRHSESRVMAQNQMSIRIRSCGASCLPRVSVPGAIGVISFEASKVTSTRAERTRIDRRRQPRSPTGTSASPARELVTTYCISCHNQKLKTGNLALDPARCRSGLQLGGDVGEGRSSSCGSRAMPPPGSRRPDNKPTMPSQRGSRAELDRAAAARPNPGRPADLHRLNRTEYANAVRDLLGVEIDGTLDASSRRAGARLRHQRRCAFGGAGAARSISDGGGEDFPPRDRRSHASARLRAVYGGQEQLERTDVAVADGAPGRRVSAGIARRHRRAPLLSRSMANMF